MMIVLRLAYAFILTCLIEYGVLVCLYEKKKEILLLSIFLNALTNIPLNLMGICLDLGLMHILWAEFSIVLIEAVGYHCLLKNWKLSFLYSLLCNAISFFTGILLEIVYCLM